MAYKCDWDRYSHYNSFVTFNRFIPVTSASSLMQIHIYTFDHRNMALLGTLYVVHPLMESRQTHVLCPRKRKDKVFVASGLIHQFLGRSEKRDLFFTKRLFLERYNLLSIDNYISHLSSEKHR